MTIVMEMGLIHPPVGLNIFVIKNIAPDIPLGDVIWGVLPFVGLMFVAVVLICLAARDRDRAARRGDGRGAGRALAAGSRHDRVPATSSTGTAPRFTRATSA